MASTLKIELDSTNPEKSSLSWKGEQLGMVKDFEVKLSGDEKTVKFTLKEDDISKKVGDFFKKIAEEMKAHGINVDIK